MKKINKNWWEGVLKVARGDMYKINPEIIEEAMLIEPLQKIQKAIEELLSLM